jgi:pimeloyl-ACP methyl ester carboxylesterase
VRAPGFLRIGERSIEYQRFEPTRAVAARPTIVMLHEGLGSLALWKDFPQQLADASATAVVAYSRFGYGQSDPPPHPIAALDMHEREALEVLPLVLSALGISRPLLFGHSDGASIAIIYAGAGHAVAGLIALAPHVFVEDMCIESIASAKQTYMTTDWPQKLGRYHKDTDGAFWLWNNVWLDPTFRAWNIEGYLPAIHCPTLIVQGYEDEYGTMEQLERIKHGVPQAQLLKLHECHHSPHRDRPNEVLAATKAFIEHAF